MVDPKELIAVMSVAQNFPIDAELTFQRDSVTKADAFPLNRVSHQKAKDKRMFRVLRQARMFSGGPARTLPSPPNLREERKTCVVTLNVCASCRNYEDELVSKTC